MLIQGHAHQGEEIETFHLPFTAVDPLFALLDMSDPADKQPTAPSDIPSATLSDGSETTARAEAPDTPSDTRHNEPALATTATPVPSDIPSGTATPTATPALPDTSSETNKAAEAARAVAALLAHATGTAAGALPRSTLSELDPTRVATAAAGMRTALAGTEGRQWLQQCAALQALPAVVALRERLQLGCTLGYMTLQRRRPAGSGARDAAANGALSGDGLSSGGLSGSAEEGRLSGPLGWEVVDATWGLPLFDVRLNAALCLCAAGTATLAPETLTELVAAQRRLTLRLLDFIVQHGVRLGREMKRECGGEGRGGRETQIGRKERES